MVIEYRGEEIVRRADGVDIAGEVQVNVLHRDDLRPASAAGAALYAEHRTERRLTHGDHRVFAYAAQPVCKADGRGGFALAGRRGRDGCDEDEFTVTNRTLIQQGQIDLCLVPAVLFEVFIFNAEPVRDLRYREHFAGLGDLYVR